MSHQVLARKFRPNRFADVVGQEHVTKTIQNAIEAGRVASAYLFSGPRGVGKTTTARIIAKALNCESIQDGNPCGKCDSCQEIKSSSSLDVLEVDGASYTGVDNIRELTETVRYQASKGRYKVIIIDEVHMLSKSSFNALLKTLEEPPPKVVFILCTTEIHKVIETIQSRCQQFTFQLIPPQEIKSRLKKLTDHEEVSLAPGVYDIVIKASGGSMRDAETTLEKIITYCGKDISEEEALKSLGLVPRELLFNLLHSIINSNPEEAFRIVQEINRQGLNLQKFIEDSIEFFRGLLFIVVAPSLKDCINLNEKEITRLKELTPHFKEPQLVLILDILCHLEKEMRFSPSPKILTEIAMVKLTRSKQVESLDHLLEQLNQGIEVPLSPPPSSPTSPDLPPLEVKQNVPPTPTLPKAPITPTIKELNIENIKTDWDGFLDFLKHSNPEIKEHIQTAELISFQPPNLTLLFEEYHVFDAKNIHSSEQKRILEKALSHYYKQHIEVTIKLDGKETFLSSPQSPTLSQESVVEEKEEEITDSIEEEVKQSDNEFLNQTLDLFNAKIVHYKPPNNQTPDKENN